MTAIQPTEDGRGRRRTLTPERHNRIIEAIKQGASLKAAAEATGTGDSTIHVWRNRGETEENRILSGEPPNPNEKIYADFARDLRQARAEAELAHIRIIKLASMPRRVSTFKRGFRSAVVNRIDDEGRPYQDVVKLEINEETEKEEFDWRASAWWLERALPETYGRKQALEVTGAEGGPVLVEGRAAELADKFAAFIEAPPEDEIEDAEIVPPEGGLTFS